MSKRLTTHQANELAGDLLGELAEHVGDAEAITLIMRRWRFVLGTARFGAVTMASVRITFRDRLAHGFLPPQGDTLNDPTADAPPGALVYTKETA